ncbi:MAG: helix-turn-helix domain-containing protein [Treponema sp.]|jgi:transcriptional regulator with XRE-family HTH domain|nr:helix-turn-helix domain-containing protein [Treponema sp.]
MDNIAERLKQIRLNEQKSQDKMAEELGIAQRSWSNYENGKSDIPFQVIMKLEAKGYSLNWILKGIELSDTQSIPNEALKIELENKNREIEILKKENSEMENQLQELEAKNKEVTDELLTRMRQLVDIQNRQLGIV